MVTNRRFRNGAYGDEEMSGRRYVYQYDYDDGAFGRYHYELV